MRSAGLECRRLLATDRWKTAIIGYERDYEKGMDVGVEAVDGRILVLFRGVMVSEKKRQDA